MGEIKAKAISAIIDDLVLSMEDRDRCLREICHMVIVRTLQWLELKSRRLYE